MFAQGLLDLCVFGSLHAQAGVSSVCVCVCVFNIRVMAFTGETSASDYTSTC